MDENQLDGMNPRQDAGVAVDANAEDARVAARRRFLKGVAGAAPVLMTLSSRPVLACYCTSASAAMSGSLSISSSHTARKVRCYGRTPGYWKTSNHFPWPSPYKTGNYTGKNGTATPTLKNGSQTGSPTMFHSVFPGSKYANQSFLQILVNGHWSNPAPTTSNQQNALARHLVAGVLNLAAGFWPSNIIPLQQLIDMYIQIIEQNKGYYLVNGGGKMYIDDAIAYLINMME